jgi:hypothetical protein
MKIKWFCGAVTLALMVQIGQGQAQNNSVKGTGTTARVAKWLDDKTIGDSGIVEIAGNVGIGTLAPTSKLTVVGTIEASNSLGTGVKAVSENGFAIHAISTNSNAILAVSPNGTAGNFLGEVSIFTNKPDSNALTITNDADHGTGLIVAGGDSVTGLAGFGLQGQGGDSNAVSGPGGDGVQGYGGRSQGTFLGGSGVVGFGGANILNGYNGPGLTGWGGVYPGNSGGQGIRALGGSGYGAGNVGGPGIDATGGEGKDGAANGPAGVFHGDVTVFGTLTKNGGSFRIDHPLDPQNKYLSHSFVESPDMMNIYNGNIVTNDKGEAVIELPPYFEALNKDFRYQLTVIGTFAQAIVAEKIKSNRFKIRTSAPKVEVSWQVTGIRQDAWANANRIKVEENKPKN